MTDTGSNHAQHQTFAHLDRERLYLPLERERDLDLERLARRRAREPDLDRDLERDNERLLLREPFGLRLELALDIDDKEHMDLASSSFLVSVTARERGRVTDSSKSFFYNGLLLCFYVHIFKHE